MFEVGIASAKRVAVLCGAVHDADRLADEIDAGAGAKPYVSGLSESTGL